MTGGLDDVEDWECRRCGMALWVPVARLDATVVGLYDDARFPGRCILMYKHHLDRFEDTDSSTLLRVQADLRRLSAVLRDVTSASRINFAVLGNAESHVHWHVIPRLPQLEARPHSSPWDDPRPKEPLDPAMREHLIESLRRGLEEPPRRIRTSAVA